MEGGATVSARRSCSVAMAVVCVVLAVPAATLAAPAPGYQHEVLSVIGGRVFRAAGEHLIEVSDLTSYCLGCHDSGAGPSRLVSALPGVRCVSPLGAHPVGVPFPMNDPELASVDSLPPAMYLEHGRLTCASCHAAEAADHGLVLPLRRSVLCLACHRK